MIKEVKIGEKCAAEKCKRNRLMEENRKRKEKEYFATPNGKKLPAIETCAQC